MIKGRDVVGWVVVTANGKVMHRTGLRLHQTFAVTLLKNSSWVQKSYFIVSLFVALLVEIYSCVIEIYNLKHIIKYYIKHIKNKYLIKAFLSRCLLLSLFSRLIPPIRFACNTSMSPDVMCRFYIFVLSKKELYMPILIFNMAEENTGIIQLTIFYLISFRFIFHFFLCPNTRWFRFLM